METGSELLEIIRFLESKGLLCLVCGEEAEWCTTWEHGKEEPCCSEHLQKHRKYHERKTTNKLYRSLLSRLQALSETHGGGLGTGNPPSNQGWTGAPELHPVHVGKKLSALPQEVVAQSGQSSRARRQTGRDPLGADFHCHVTKR